jgi:hypothetical protein
MLYNLRDDSEFSKIDLKNCFIQIPLKEKDKKQHLNLSINYMNGT